MVNAFYRSINDPSTISIPKITVQDSIKFLAVHWWNEEITDSRQKIKQQLKKNKNLERTLYNSKKQELEPEV